MKFSTPPVCLLFFVCLSNCQNGSDHILEKFKTVDSSIQTSTVSNDHSFNQLYTTISKKRSKNSALVAQADSIFSTTNHALKLIDSLKDVLQSKDTSGNDLDLSTQLLVGTKTGDQLKIALTNVADITAHTVANETNKARLADILTSIHEIKTDKFWTKKYFHSTPTVATITILNKFQNDCTNAATTAMNDIGQRLGE